jgi:hypothetical protein
VGEWRADVSGLGWKENRFLFASLSILIFHLFKSHAHYILQIKNFLMKLGRIK